MFLCPLTTPENLKVFCLQGVEKLLLVFSQVVKWNPWPEVGKTLTWILLVSSSRVVSIFIHVFKFSMFTGDLKHPVFFQNVLEVLSSHCGTTCSLNFAQFLSTCISEAYIRPQTSVMKLFWENNEQLKAVNKFYKKVLS